MIKNVTIKDKLSGEVVEVAETLPSGAGLKEHIRNKHGAGKYLVISTGKKIVDGMKRNMPIQETVIISGSAKRPEYGAIAGDVTTTILMPLIQDLKNRLDEMNAMIYEISEKVSVMYHEESDGEDNQPEAMPGSGNADLLAAFAELQNGTPLKDLMVKYPQLVSQLTSMLGGQGE